MSLSSIKDDFVLDHASALVSSSPAVSPSPDASPSLLPPQSPSPSVISYNSSDSAPNPIPSAPINLSPFVTETIGVHSLPVSISPTEPLSPLVFHFLPPKPAHVETPALPQILPYLPGLATVKIISDYPPIL
ncbi:unnamed protein product [Peniophora sp. CBMAI 1063]|nr:unnamed protein product [Peniophora sp. CBMAI 1063]